MKKSFVALAACLMLAKGALAQIDLTASLAVPVGAFAEKDDGMAQPRFGVSGAYYKPFSPELSVGGEVGFIMNTLDRSRFAAELLDQGASDVSVGGGTYLNFPVLLSVLFAPAPLASSGISLYGSAGIDFMRMTDMTLKIDGYQGGATFDPGPAFAFGVGAQAAFGRFFVGLRYMNLGEHDISGTMTFEGERQPLNGSQEVSVLNLLLGVRI